MIIRSLLAPGLFVCFTSAHAQIFSWAAPVVGGGSGRAVAVDTDGNVYTCGNASGQVDFDPGPNEVLSPPGTGVNGDICVVKYTDDGNYLWHYLVGGSSADVAKNIVVDGNGDVLVTGSFSGSLRLGRRPGYGDARLGPIGMLRSQDLQLPGSSYGFSSLQVRVRTRTTGWRWTLRTTCT